MASRGHSTCLYRGRKIEEVVEGCQARGEQAWACFKRRVEKKRWVSGYAVKRGHLEVAEEFEGWFWGWLAEKGKLRYCDTKRPLKPYFGMIVKSAYSEFWREICKERLRLGDVKGMDSDELPADDVEPLEALVETEQRDRAKEIVTPALATLTDKQRICLLLKWKDWFAFLPPEDRSTMSEGDLAGLREHAQTNGHIPSRAIAHLLSLEPDDVRMTQLRALRKLRETSEQDQP